MRAAPRLQHLPGDLLGISPEANELLARRELWDASALFLPRQLGDFDPEAAGNQATARSDRRSVGDALDPRERELLVQRLQSAVAPFTPHVRVLDSVGAAQDARATFVVTRVEPCLLGPRLEDLFGVLQAIRLARELTGFEKRPALPLVWVREDLPATQRLCSASLLGPHHDLLRLSALPPAHEDSPLRASDFVPDPSCIPLLRAQLRQSIVTAPHRDSTLSLLLPDEGESLGSRTRRILLELFGSEGLLVCGPSDFREDLAHELSWSVDRGRESLSRLPENEILCFDQESREPLIRGGDGYRKPGEPGSRTGAELAAEIIQAPDRFHAGPRVEPAILRRAFPIQAWIGDRQDVASEFGLAGLNDPERGRIAWIPRWQATWLEPRDVEALERLQQVPQDYIPRRTPNKSPDAVQIESEVQAQLARPRASMKELMAQFRANARELLALDATLGPLLRRQTRMAEERLETFLERAERALRNRGGTRARHQRRLANALNPRGRHSSEVFGLLRPLARYGPEALRDLSGEIETFTFEHVLIFTA